MGADNWRQCPRCVKQAAETNAKRVRELKAKYGKLDADDYVRQMNELNETEELDPTMREDFGAAVDTDGKFRVSYKAHCDSCGFEFKYRHEEDAKP